MLGLFSMKAKTRMVVVEVVSQHLDELKNNYLISNLYDFLPGRIGTRWLV